MFNVPAKYLGSEVNRLIGKIDDEAANNISIPVTANITGTYTNPSVKTDLSSSVSKLTNQLVEIEKQKLLNQGKDKVTDLLGGFTRRKRKPIHKTNNSNRFYTKTTNNVKVRLYKNKYR